MDTNNQAKYAEAKANGYSDTEIAQHLGGAKYAEAIKEGHTDADIIKHFTGVSIAPQRGGDSPLMSTVKDAVRAALPSPDFNKPIQPTSSNPVIGGLQAAGQTLRDPTRISPTLGVPGQVAGNKVEEKIGGTTGKVAGTITSLALDPNNYLGTELPMIKAAYNGAAKVGNGILKTIMKIGANVSDASIAQGAKAGWKLPNVAAHEVEAAVGRVQTALKESTESAGKALNEAKAKIGLPVTPEEKEVSLVTNNNVYGLGKQEINEMTRKFIEKKSRPEDLAKNITQFKTLAKNAENHSLNAKVALSLQDQINEFVNWEKSGNQVEGLLKQQHKELGQIVQKALPKEVRSRMAQALELKDDLEKSLGLTETEGTGKAEQFLRSVFEGKSAKSKDTLKRFADLEAFTGQPVLSELFKKFAGQDLHKLAGKNFIAQTAGVSLLTGGLFNPMAGASGAALLATQSPRLLNAVGRVGSKVSGAAESVSPYAVRAARGLGMSQQNKEELDKTLERLKNAH